LILGKDYTASELSDRTQWRNPWNRGVPMEPFGPSEEPWPWFSGRREDLGWFKLTWEAHVKRHYTGTPEEVLRQMMCRYCVSMDIEKGVEVAKNLVEAWWP
jgi:hypothetical protein